MLSPETNLLKLYIPLIQWVGLGLFSGLILPKTVPLYVGKALFWVGVPVSIVSFLRNSDFSGSVWVAPLIAWFAMLAGVGLAWMWVQLQLYSASVSQQHCLKTTRSAEAMPLETSLEQRSPLSSNSSSLLHKPTQGSFLLAAMVGNTGYLGYPVVLNLLGTQYFAWALFYDLLGTTLGAYGLGVLLAARFGRTIQHHSLLKTIAINPALWSFGFGLAFRQATIPLPVEQGLKAGAWTSVALSLVLIGMRLSQLSSWRSLKDATTSLAIKMVIVPLLIGLGLSYVGMAGVPRSVIVLQMAMPPAFATLVLTEAFDLDRELTVTALALGSIVLLVMIPFWLWLFAA